MTSQVHGLSIGIERVDNHFFISFKAIGKLTHADYEKITPMLDAALSEVKDPNVNVLIDATQLRGWDLHAAWDDFRLGLKHSNKFAKIAIYGNKDWQEVCAKMCGWFISGESKFFDNQSDAINWLKET